MNKTTLEAFKAHALRDYPREACGLLVVIKGRLRYIPCRNLADSPTEMFILPGEDYAAAEDLGEITAICHSHPDHPASPSLADKAVCEALALPSYIVSVMPSADGTPQCAAVVNIVPEGYQAPYVERPFVHGVFDCYSLCRDWYQREHNIELPDFVRRDGWWDDGNSKLYMENFAKAGFVEMSRHPEEFIPNLQPGDGLLMQIRSKNDTPNHAAIYLGNGQILQHCYGRLSSRDVYGGMWLECTRLIVRHRSFL